MIHAPLTVDQETALDEFILSLGLSLQAITDYVTGNLIYDASISVLLVEHTQAILITLR